MADKFEKGSAFWKMLYCWSIPTAAIKRDAHDCTWWRSDTKKSIYYKIISVLSIGLVPILALWFPSLRYHLLFQECNPLNAEFVISYDEEDGHQIENCISHTISGKDHLLSIEYRSVRYYASNLNDFKFVRVPDLPPAFSRFLDTSYYEQPKENNEDAEIQLENTLMEALYGRNEMCIPSSGFLEILFVNAISPFYLFQYFSVAVWLLEDYVAYSLIILLITMSAIYYTTTETLYNLKQLKKLAATDTVVKLLGKSTHHHHSNSKDGDGYAGDDGLESRRRRRQQQQPTLTVYDKCLLPGQHFLVYPGQVVPCDAVLICGKVVVDEAMLTGESVPVSKGPIDVGNYRRDEAAAATATATGSSSPSSTKPISSLRQFFHSIGSIEHHQSEGVFSHLNSDDDDDENELEESLLYTAGNNSATRNGNGIENTSPSSSGRSSSSGSSNIKGGDSSDPLQGYTSNMLFAGTVVTSCFPSSINTNNSSSNVSSMNKTEAYCIAVVCKTGFRSAKGQLVASLLQPKEGYINNHFISDTWSVLSVLIGLTVVLVTLDLVMLWRISPLSTRDIIFLYLDAVTIAVPPALTACLTVATAVSMERLKDCHDIFISDTSRLNFAGSINTVCFDKTGTLTENTLNFVGASVYRRAAIDSGQKESHSSGGGSASSALSSSIDKEFIFYGATDVVPPLCQQLMATCHNLSLIGRSSSSGSTRCGGGDAGGGETSSSSGVGVVVEARGDPLEEELLRASGWTLTRRSTPLTLTATATAATQHLSTSSSTAPQIGSTCNREEHNAAAAAGSHADNLVAYPPHSKAGYEIVKHFEFTPEKQRSGAIVYQPSNNNNNNPSPSEGIATEAGAAAVTNPQYIYLVKGSPEVILKLVHPTYLPEASVLKESLSRLVKDGLRVIAMAALDLSDMSSWKINSATQSDIEKRPGIKFLGYLCLSSVLRPESIQTMRELERAHIVTCMITGDHIHTSLAVARQCGLLWSGDSNRDTKRSSRSRSSSSSSDNMDTTAEKASITVDVAVREKHDQGHSSSSRSSSSKYGMDSRKDDDNDEEEEGLLGRDENGECKLDDDDDNDDDNDNNYGGYGCGVEPIMVTKNSNTSDRVYIIDAVENTQLVSSSGAASQSTCIASLSHELGSGPTFQIIDGDTDVAIISDDLIVSLVQLIQRAHNCNKSNAKKSKKYRDTSRNYFSKAIRNATSLGSKSGASTLKGFRKPSSALADDDDDDDGYSDRSNSNSNSLRQVQLAITGKGLRAVHSALSPHLFTSLLRNVRVFARTKPADKQFIVEVLMHSAVVDVDETLHKFMAAATGNPLHMPHMVTRHKNSSAAGPIKSYGSTVDNGKDSIQRANGTSVASSSSSSPPAWTVARTAVAGLKAPDPFGVLFCGDGANDMQALRAASVGVSLCDAETSVAAPITSRTPTPFSVITVLKEGRCSLVTAYTLILFNVMYGTIQLFMACILYSYGLTLGNYMYLTQDLVFTLGCGLALSNNLPATQLSVAVPPSKFVCKYFVVKFSLQLLCFVAFQVIALWALSVQPFYEEYDPIDSGDEPLTKTYSYEATTIDCMALAQLSIASVAASIGMPFRKPWYRNPWHIAMLSFQVSWVIAQTLGRSGYVLEHLLEIKPLPMYFALTLLGIMGANAVVSGALTALTNMWFRME